MRELSEKSYETIDKYITEKMNSSEALAFEEMVTTDPELAEEVKLRRLIIESVKYKREQEIKAYIRRNSMVGLSNNIWGKKFTIFSAILILGTGIALFLIDPESQRHNEPYRKHAPQENTKDTLENGVNINKKTEDEDNFL